jgi:hypothetical protein
MELHGSRRERPAIKSCICAERERLAIKSSMQLHAYAAIRHFGRVLFKSIVRSEDDGTREVLCGIARREELRGIGYFKPVWHQGVAGTVDNKTQSHTAALRLVNASGATPV